MFAAAAFAVAVAAALAVVAEPAAAADSVRLGGLSPLPGALMFPPGRVAWLAEHGSRASSAGAAVEEPKKQWFTQILDHFDGQNQATWQQRFYVNESFFKQDGGPIFLQLGGEGAISPAYVTALEMAVYAQKFGALQVAVEHRFYGESHPLPDMSLENLRYLSSQQALADAANFVGYIREQYPKAGPVIVFGGSYPGALSSWFRLQFPASAKAAIASSAPVLAVEDMTTYLTVVDKSLDVIGGVECDDAVRKAFQRLDSLMDTPSGQTEVMKDFNTCTAPTAALDQASLVSNLAGLFMGTVQYNREIPGRPTVTDLCKAMTAGAPRTQEDAYKNLVKLVDAASAPSCSDIAFADQVKQLKDVNNWGLNTVGIRQWVYQTCTEFGFFQTTDAPASKQPFGTKLPLSYYTELCSQVYDIKTGPHISFTNRYYGGNKPLGASRVYYVNGSVDPWHSLSVLTDLTPSLKALLINGTAHCANMSPYRAGDPPALKDAQTKIAAQIDEWIKAPWE